MSTKNENMEYKEYMENSTNLCTIEVIQNLCKDNSQHARAYRQGAQHMLRDVIDHLSESGDIENLDYFRQQLGEMER